MKYQVVVEEAAEEDLEAIVLWIAQSSEHAALAWYWKVQEAISSLERFPLRCPIAPESKEFDEEIRQLLQGRGRYVYRVLFTVQEGSVRVLHVRHGSQAWLRPED
ncbi:MAG: type II toxin-antitoxin system RelE/ParE family toxin [Candidatus Hydrogenedentes bacterium]|nr:type II toxin-antitoxin system RelE/ParE family toxin [Candidatus Hydrogenedentota bacterium]